MFNNILLIIFGIAILVLPLTTDIVNDKKVTKYGKIFLFVVLIFAILQIVNERMNSINNSILEKDKIELSNKVDSLHFLSTNLSDSLNTLRKVLTSIDSQFYVTNSTLIGLKNDNNELQKSYVKTDRPILFMNSSRVHKSKDLNKLYVDIIFLNIGKRAATNVKGKIYAVSTDKVNPISLGITTSEIFPYNKGFTTSIIWDINKDSVICREPIYFYVNYTYSDLILNILWSYESIMKLDTFSNNNYSDRLNLCSQKELEEIKSLIKKNNFA